MVSATPTSHRFVSQRLDLHYVDWGNASAPPLLLVHGGRDHCRSWDWVAERLRTRWHVIAPDLRGHGDSAWSPDADYAMPAFTLDLADLIHQLDVPAITILGHSLGGAIALRYAGLYPDLARGLIVIEGLGLSPKLLAERAQRPLAERWRAWISARRAVGDRRPRLYATFEEALERMRTENPHLTSEQAQHLTLHAAARQDDGRWGWKFDPYLHVFPPADLEPSQVHELWHSITCPTLLCYGAQSWASNPATDGRVSHFRHARVALFPDAGHWVHHDQLDPFMHETEAFLATL